MERARELLDHSIGKGREAGQDARQTMHQNVDAQGEPQKKIGEFAAGAVGIHEELDARGVGWVSACNIEVTGCSRRHGQEKRGWSTLWLYGDPRDIHCYSRSHAERRVSQ